MKDLNLKNLINTLKKEINIDKDDNTILKDLVYNTAIKDVLEIIRRYEAGEIDQELLKELNRNKLD